MVMMFDVTIEMMTQKIFGSFGSWFLSLSVHPSIRQIHFTVYDSPKHFFINSYSHYFPYSTWKDSKRRIENVTVNKRYKCVILFINDSYCYYVTSMIVMFIDSLFFLKIFVRRFFTARSVVVVSSMLSYFMSPSNLEIT